MKLFCTADHTNQELEKKCNDLVQILLNYLGDGPLIAAEVIRRSWERGKEDEITGDAKLALLFAAARLNHVPDLDRLDYRGT